MGKQNNTKQNGIAAKGSNPIVIKNKNLRTQNGSKPSGKQSLSANAASSKVSNSSVARNKTTTTAAAEDHSAIGAKGPTDRSQLNFPYDIRINGFSSMLNTVKKATPKVRKLLLDECDIIMECKFCRNLFRSVPNFISHKHNYCKSMYHPSSENGCSQLIQQRSNMTGIEYQLDTSAIDHLPPVSNFESSSTSHSNGIMAEDLESRSSLSLYNDICEVLKNKDPVDEESSNNQHVKLVIEPINNRKDLIVFQRKVTETDPSICDSSNNLYDSRAVIDRDTAILGPDGKVICTGTEIGIERIVKRLTTQIEISQRKMVQDSTNQVEEKCDICKTVFNTEKALRQHRRDAPDCVKQSSTAKIPNGPSHSGTKLVPAKLQAKSQLADEDSSSTSVQDDSIKRSKMEESKAKSLFVKQLFSKASPAKAVSSILSSPTKSPMFVKKLLSATSQKTSPYKNISSVNNKLQMPSNQNVVVKKKILSPVKRWKSMSSQYSSQMVLSCGKCSSTFNCRSDMSMHLTKCTGVINFSLLRQYSSPEKKKTIGIQVRHSYTKPTDASKSLVTENRKSYTSTLKDSPSSSINSLAAASLGSDKPLPCEKSTMNELSGETLGPGGSKVPVSLPNHIVKINVISGTKRKLQLTEEDHSNSMLPKSNGDLSETEMVGEADNSSTSSGSSEVESISNITDSGVSSGTTPSEGHSDFRTSPADLHQTLQLPSSSSRKTKSESQSKKNSNPEDRVLTPKNKILRATINSRKRKSTRIQIKEDTILKAKNALQKNK